MSGTTISSTTTSGITLTTIYTVITHVGSVGNIAANGKAIAGPTGTNWTLVNQGLVSETASNGIGISFASAGTITNASGGTITAYSQGIVLTGGGAVTNASGAVITVSNGIDISASASAVVVNAGKILNTPTIASTVGVTLADGGTVTNQATGTIAADYGVKVSGATGTVTNLGTILAHYAGSYFGRYGVLLADGGKVVNGAAGGTVSSALIDGYYGDVKFGATGTGTFVNYGVVFDQTRSYFATNGAAVLLNTGTVINGAGGDIRAKISASGNTALRFDGTGTVVNYGTIINTQHQQEGVSATYRYYGAILTAGGVVSNIGSASVIEGYVGVYGVGGVTVTNAGTIMTNASYANPPPTYSYPAAAAVKFGAGTNRLIVDPGAVFYGLVDGTGIFTTTGTTTLELASSAATGTIHGLGTQFVDFPQITVDAGAHWTISGVNSIASGITLTNAGTLFDTGALTNAGSIGGSGKIEIGLSKTLVDTGSIAAGQTIAFSGIHGLLDVAPAGFNATIGNFQAGDTIALTGVNDITAHTIVNGNTLDLTRSGGSHIDLTLDRDYSTGAFTTTTAGANTDITTTAVTCFAAGTALDTPDGPVAVEALRVGDRVLTATGKVRPIRWIGHRRLDVARHPAPNTVGPIRILAGALADGSPRRDLLLSPDHALLLDGVLIPVRLLRNDATIRREERCSVVTYYHVELDAHDVLLAEGAAAESYLDTGNRDSFDNAGVPRRLHPDLEGAQRRRETESCARFVADPVRTEPVWRRLAQRAAQLGRTPPERVSADTDPALRVVCAGRSFVPVAVEGACHRFLLPAWEGTLRLRSRDAIPNEVTPWIEDQRRLGVMIRRLTLTTPSGTRTIPVDHPALGQGWWDVEQEGGAMWRWTDGDAAIAIASGGPCRLDIEVAGAAMFARRPAVGPSAMRAA